MPSAAGVEMVTAALHYRLSGREADLLFYGDRERDLPASIEVGDPDLAGQVVDDLVTLLTTALKLDCETTGLSPLGLWQQIAQRGNDGVL